MVGQQIENKVVIILTNWDFNLVLVVARKMTLFTIFGGSFHSG